VLLARSVALFVLPAVFEIGGVFVAGSLAWGMVTDGYRPDRSDVIGALVCFAGVAVIMCAPVATDQPRPDLPEPGSTAAAKFGGRLTHRGHCMSSAPAGWLRGAEVTCPR
jgi:hypothetical protein